MSWGVEALTVRYGSRPAIEKVSLEVPAGQVTAVVGGDGAGKTTLLRALVGLVAVEDGTVHRPGDPEIGYLSSTSGTYPDLSVEENLAFAATAYGLDAGRVRDRTHSYLERTGLARFGDRLAGDLSGGMRQKLGVVRALIHRPPLLVLDEPTTGVDPVSRSDLWWLIAHAAADGAAVVFATTYLDEAERAAQLLVLDGGRTLATGTAGEIVASMPGTIVTRPGGLDDTDADAAAAARAWRRRGQWRQWDPPGVAATPGRARLEPDLQDAVTVFLLERELAA